MAINSDGIGYPLPDEIDPAEAVCIRVYVPADPLYIGSFWQAYAHFGKWLAWARDDAHRGKDAAAVWRPYIQQARDEWDASAGDCGMVNVRQNPDNPCILEVQTLAGGAWVEFADLDLCKFAPGEKLYPDGEGWKELDDTLWHLKVLIEQIDSWLVDGKDADEILLLVSSQVQRAPGIATLVNNMAGMSAGDRTTAIAALDWDETRFQVWCQSNCLNLYDTDYYQWLNCISDAMFDYLNTLDSVLLEGLTSVSSWLLNETVVREWAQASGGGGTGFGGVSPACGWMIEWDFTLGDGGFTPEGSFDAGVWSAAGWGTSDTSLGFPLTRRRHFFIERTWSPAFTLTKLEMEFDYDKGDWNPDSINAWYAGFGASILFAVHSTGVADGIGITHSWTGSLTSDHIIMQLMSSLSEYDNVWSGSATLKKLRIWGTGTPPAN